MEDDPVHPTLADRELARDLLLGAVSDDGGLLVAAVARVATLDRLGAVRLATASATLGRAVIRALAPNGPVASLTIRRAHVLVVEEDRRQDPLDGPV